MSNYYKKTTVISKRTTITLKGGGTVTSTKLNVLLEEVGLKSFDVTWREDATRNLDDCTVKEINSEMMRLVGSLLDIRA